MKHLTLFLTALILSQFTLHAQTVDTLWSEDWEGDWLVDWHVDGGTWEVGDATSGPDTAYAGSNCAATVLSGNYSEPVDTRLIRHTSFVVPAASENPRLRFWYWMSFSTDDYGQVQIKVSGGEWETVSITMNNRGSDAWSYGAVDLSDYAGSTVQIAFQFHSNKVGTSSDVSTGWYIDDISLITGSYILNSPEGFESGFGDWSVDEGTWEVGVPTSGPGSAYEGQNCAGTNLDGSYAEPADSRLISPPFLVPGASENPRIRFWYWMMFSINDYGKIQIKTSKGAWETVSITMNNRGSDAWSYGAVDLSDYADSTVQVAFQFHSRIDGTTSDVTSGWYIDGVSLVTGPYVLNSPEGFESGFGDWSVDEGTWEVGVPTSGPGSAHGGQNCVGTNLEGNYSEPADSRLISPPFLVPGASENPRLRFWYWMKFYADDYGQIQIKTSSSAWKTVSIKMDNRGSDAWSYGAIDLLDYADSTVQVAFQFHSNIVGTSSDVSTGWYIDDVSLVTGPYVLNSPEGFEAGFGDWSVDEGTWEVGVPTSGPGSAHGGQNCVGTNLEGNYSEPADSRLISPPFLVPGASENPRLRFWYWMKFYADDYGQIQIKTSSGAWKTVSIKMDNRGSDAWSYGAIDLLDYADSTVQVAFQFHSNIVGTSSDVSTGWYIDDISLITGPYVMHKPEGFESGFGDWSVDEGTWEVGVPTSGPGSAYGGELCAGTNLDGNYEEPADSRLISPPFRVPAASENPAFRFWHWYSFSVNDYGLVQISIDEGVTWETLSNQFINTSSGTWTPYYVSLSPYAGTKARLAYFFHSRIDGTSSDVSTGWYIDEVSIDGVTLDTIIIVENDLSVQWLEPVSRPLCGTGKEQPIIIEVENKGFLPVSSFEVGYSVDSGNSFVVETVFETINPGSTLDYTFRNKADMTEADSFHCVSYVSIMYDSVFTNDTTRTTIVNDRNTFDLLITDTECNQSTGTAQIMGVSGITGSYETYWTSGDTGMVATNLAAGIYFVTITDNQKCSLKKTFVINDIGAPELSLPQSNIVDVSCFGKRDGSIDIFPTGGAEPYSYRWSNGATIQDIDNLSPGQYDVTIKDANGCTSTQNFFISEPAPLRIRSKSSEAFCGETTGSAELIVSGGTAPYTYAWNSGHSSNTVSGLAGGIYTAIVTDDRGCVDSIWVSINEIGAPQVLVTAIEPATCGLNNGGIDISMADPAHKYTYNWSDGSTTEDLQNAAGGIYSITVSYKGESCSTNQIIKIPIVESLPGEICLISVDSITGENTVVMKDPADPTGIDLYNIYQLNTIGEYQYISSMDPNATNTSVDEASNTEITSYSYRITQVDGCGNESEPGSFHETVHTVVSPDFNGNRANIFWNSYKGVDYNSFQIHRYSGIMGLEIIDTVPKNEEKEFYRYTDDDPPIDDTVYYVIIIETSGSCDSIKKAGTHNTIRSNKSKKLKFGTTLVNDPETIRYLNIFPNPNNGSFTLSLEVERKQDLVLRIFDATGRLISNLQYDDIQGRHEETIQVNDIKPGLYYLQILMNDGITSRSFVVR